MPFPRSNMSVVLTVKTGLHKGAALTLGRDTMIGQGEESQMRLLDDGIVDRHARLVLHRNGLTVAPLSGAVCVAGNPQVAAVVHRLRHGATLDVAFGPVVATLARPARKGPSALRLFGLALMAMVIVLPAPWHGPTLSAASVMRAAPLTDVVPVPAPPSRAQIAQAVASRFAELKLNRTLQIRVDGDGTRALSTTVSGNVEPGMLRDFAIFLAWYDAQRDWPALFNLTERQSPADRPLPAIAAILLSPVPGLLTDDGRRVAVGEALPGGWTLTSVDKTAVVLTLAGQDHVITLLPAPALGAP